jgi:hypothetical protein
MWAVYLIMQLNATVDRVINLFMSATQLLEAVLTYV